MIAFMIYLLSSVDGILVLVKACAVISGIIAGVILITVAFTYCTPSDFKKKDEVRNIRRAGVLTTIIFLLISMVAVLIPNSKTIAAMYLVPKLVNNEQVQELPSKLMRVVNLKMDTWIDELVDEEKPTKESE